MEERDKLSEKIIGCAIDVHKELGPGLLESMYEEALGIELAYHGVSFLRQVELPVIYKGSLLAGSFRIDMIVENRIILELKCVETILPVHKAQLLSYLHLSSWKTGLLLNFKSAIISESIIRMVL